MLRIGLLVLMTAFPTVQPAATLLEPQPIDQQPISPSNDSGADEDRPPIETIVQGDSVVKTDRSGHGAVLCTWQILVTVQSATKACNWVHLPADDAIDTAIAEMDRFIIENMPTPTTQEMLEDGKRRQSEMVWAGPPEQVKQMCAVGEDMDTTGAFAWRIRQQVDPESFIAGIRESLSVPREPVMNPCL